ncbi:MAG: hypothetical protein ACRDZN_16585 [Acidimicrobiales bacterium]
MTVATDEVPIDKARADWDAHDFDVPLEIVESPYRDLTEPLLAFLDDLDARWDDDTITVVIPEIVVHRWYEHALHNQSALALKARMLFRDNTVVISVPWHYDPQAGAGRWQEEQVVTVPQTDAYAAAAPAPAPAPESANEPPAGDERQVE